MTTYMFDIMVVTNRHLCQDEFLARIEKIAQAHPSGIILREKDMEEKTYRELARCVLEICERYKTPCILHNFVEVAIELQAVAVHLSLPVLRKLSQRQKDRFMVIGVSCHSAEEAKEAESLGCTYITAGHIFDTKCKKGLPGRGILFLREICEITSVPVYAIGGIAKENIQEIRNTPAAGACVMSGPMVCKDEAEYLKNLLK